MNHTPFMVTDLAFILAAAAVSTLLFKKFKQPIVLGYLIAGFLMGPHVHIWPSVVDTKGVQLWAELGVIFLLFGLGLEFSFKKLAKVGKSASISAICEVVAMIMLGYMFGRICGWGHMDSIFLGSALSMSSTTIIIKAFDEAGLKGRGFVNLVFGILIVEDLIAILLIVFLTAINSPEAFSGLKLIYLSIRLGFFLLIWFLVGIYVLPSFLKKVRNLLTNEIMLILSICLCFIMVVLASKAGFSAALGAFVMGSILAETQEGERIEHLLLPVKDLFAAVFFVSVGMLIDPYVLKENLGIVILITLLTIFGKFFGSSLGALLSGRSLKQSFQAGMSLSQIGEFSFIIATLGMTLNVTSSFLYPVIIAISAVTTFTTPYMIRFSGPIYNWIEKKLPQSALISLKKYEIEMSTVSKENIFLLSWKLYGLSALLNTVVVVAVALFSKFYFLPFLINIFGDTTAVSIIASVLTLIIAAPFISALVLKSPKNISKDDDVGVFRMSKLQTGVLTVRIIFALALIIFVINQFKTTKTLFIFVSIAASIFIYLSRKFLKPFYYAIEKRFLVNLNAKEFAEMEKMAKRSGLAPWDATLVELVLSSDSILAGLTLQESEFRSKTKATVAMIERGSRSILAPGKLERFLPGDRIFLIGTDDELSAAQKLIEVQNNNPPPPEDIFGLECVLISDRSIYANKTILENGIGEEFGGIIVGIERNFERILNPKPSEIIMPGDLIWIFGNNQCVRALKQVN